MPDVNTNGSVYSSYDIIPVAAAVALTTVHSVAVTENWKWVLTGTNDGRISKWDFFASLNGKTPLTQIQRSNYPESILNVKKKLKKILRNLIAIHPREKEKGGEGGGGIFC
ncbi:Transcription factor spt8 [Coelomomyces lativittatus]|nr:Transcription factor spt8 [Coelomomyces lativittatus]